MAAVFIPPRELVDEILSDYEAIRRNRGWESDETRIVKVIGKIVGYRHFQIRPLVRAQMLLQLFREPENQYDRFAVKVVSPAIANISQELLDVETRPHPRKQVVRDILNKTIGRVPGKYCKIISNGLQNGKIVRAHAVFMGNITNYGAVAGGGPQLWCLYLLDVHVDDYESITRDLLHVPGAIRYQPIE